MQREKRLQVSVLFLALFLLAVASGQEKASEGLNEAAPATFGGNADRWLHELIGSDNSVDSRISLDRLSYFQLSPAQLEKLTAAVDGDESRDKRVMLWQAMRQSRDVKTRDYLIRVLLEEGVEMQTQFLDELENPTRFDVPILIALYNSQRPQRAMPKAKSKTTAGESDVSADFGDLYDVPRKIVELASHTQWGSVQMVGWPHSDGQASEYTNPQMLESRNRRGIEAVRAQEQMVEWLIKNGYQDDHRLTAFQMYSQIATVVSVPNSSTVPENLLKGLRSDESRARAVRLVLPWIEPHKFLVAKEPEIVRLSAIEAMHYQVTQSTLNQLLLDRENRLTAYKQMLAQFQKSDPSPKVQAAAGRCLEGIAYCEQNFHRVMRALTRDSR